MALSLLRAALCQHFHTSAALDRSSRFGLWPSSSKTWCLELLTFFELLWQKELGLLGVRRCSAKSSLLGPAELKCVSQSICRVCCCPLAKLSWSFWQLSFWCLVAAWLYSGFSSAEPAEEPSILQPLGRHFWNAGETTLHTNTAKFISLAI